MRSFPVRSDLPWAHGRPSPLSPAVPLERNRVPPSRTRLPYPRRKASLGFPWLGRVNVALQRPEGCTLRSSE